MIKQLKILLLQIKIYNLTSLSKQAGKAIQEIRGLPAIITIFLFIAMPSMVKILLTVFPIDGDNITLSNNSSTPNTELALNQLVKNIQNILPYMCYFMAGMVAVSTFIRFIQNARALNCPLPIQIQADIEKNKAYLLALTAKKEKDALFSFLGKLKKNKNIVLEKKPKLL